MSLRSKIFTFNVTKDQSLDHLFLGKSLELPNKNSLENSPVIPPGKIVYNNGFLYYLLKTNTFKNFAKNYSSGTTVLHLNKNGILNYRFALPDNSVLDKISRILNCIIVQKDKSIAQHKTLVKIRDLLLPKIINGEIGIYQ